MALGAAAGEPAPAAEGRSAQTQLPAVEVVETTPLPGVGLSREQIAAPVQSGYGSSLIRDLIPHELGGTVDLVFASDGACCKIEILLERR